MLQYAICEIAGKQYKISPGQEIALTSPEKFETKVLLLAEDGKLQVGKPYLDIKLPIEVTSKEKGRKTRVAKFHAKANYRKVRGSRAKIVKVIWQV